MNKKKSKALAFLLAASLLVPSANGIVSAAELERGNSTAVVEKVESTGDSSTTDEDATEESAKTIRIDSTDKLNNINKTISEATEGSTIVIATNVSGTEIKSPINISKKNIKICGESKITENGNELTGVTLKGKKIFDIQESGVTISNLILENTLENKSEDESSKSVLIGIKKDLIGETTIDGCYFRGLPIWNLINYPKASKLNFINNNVKMKARAMIVGVDNGSVISGNKIDLIEEKYSNLDRTGVLSITADADEGNVNITNNTFINANRVIGVDNATISGDALKIKDNKFINTRFAFETDSRTEKKPEDDKELKNNGNSYDLSGNYYNYGGKIGPLRIEDASSKGSHFEEGSSTELKIDDKTPLNIAVGPYYTTEDASGNLGGAVNIGVATVNGKDYKTLKDAIAALKDGGVMELRQDIELTKTNEILVGKKVTITSAENKDGKKYTIGLKGINTIALDTNKVDSQLILKNINMELRENDITCINSGVGNNSATIEMEGCNVTSKDGVQSEGNFIAGKTSTIKMKKNYISAHVRGMVVNIGNGSVIEENTFDSQGEKFEYEDGKINRTGILSLVADENGEVTIKNNTFKNANRAIGVDYSNIKAGNLTIEGNKFIGVRFAFELDPTKENNQNKNYDLSRNYFEFGGKVSAPKVQDAHARDNDTGHKGDFTYNQTTGNSTELVLNDYANESFVKKLPSVKVGPYYTNINKTELSDGSHRPSIPSRPIYIHEEIIGSDRYDTAAKIADKLGSYDNVVLVNAESSMSDGLSASGLAGKENGAILLTKKDSIPKVTMDRIKKVKKVYIIGGESAISAKVAKEITAANIKVERLGGKTRVETSEIVAKKLGNYNKAFVVNGFKGEADAMSASAVAAKNKAPILLTNGKESTHDKKSGVKYYVIGGNNVVDKSIADKYGAEVLAGKDRYATNREVIDEFYSGRDKVYIANGDKLVDALTASPLAKNNGIVLVNKKSDKSILKGKDTVQVGGMDFEIDFE